MMKRRLLIFLSAPLLIIIVSAIDLSQLDDYAGQAVPDYILRDNTPSNNLLTNRGATLGRVLFYDKQLSLNGTISCASCHIQAFAFSDTALVSSGVAGVTARHSMRLAYSRFSEEESFFWNKRANSLETQTTMPILDFAEMGFSGFDGQPPLDSLIRRMANIPYYQVLFDFVFGSQEITEEKLQFAMAQFVRSIYSFDSKFDAGLAITRNPGVPFPNFSPLENQGKSIFLDPPPQGAGCQGCHRLPEFDISPTTGNNGVIGTAANLSILDLNNTRAPSLRDLVNNRGTLNGPFMHNGNFRTLRMVIDHYNLIPQNPENTNLDPRLAGPGGNLQLTNQQKDALEAFLKTLTSTAIYTDSRWSDPFNEDGTLALVTRLKNQQSNKLSMQVYPNPAFDEIRLTLPTGKYQVEIFGISGQVLLKTDLPEDGKMDISSLPTGALFIVAIDKRTGALASKQIQKVR